MYRLDVTGGSLRISEVVAAQAEAMRGLPRVVAARIAPMLAEENRARAEAGLDRHGRPLAELAPATLADPRRSPGPPMAPGGAESNTVGGFRVDPPRMLGASDVLVRGHWPDSPYLKYHAPGPDHSRRLPVRDISTGPTPAMDRRAGAIARAELEAALRGTGGPAGGI